MAHVSLAGSLSMRAMRQNFGGVLDEAPTVMFWGDTPISEKVKLYKYASSFLIDKRMREARAGSTNGLIALDRGDGSKTIDSFFRLPSGIIASYHEREMSHGQAQHDEAENWDFMKGRRDSAAQIGDNPVFKYEGGRFPNVEPVDPITICAIEYTGSAADRDNSPCQKKLRQWLRKAAFRGSGLHMRASKHLSVTIALNECDYRAILNGEIEYNEYNNEECYVEVCRSLAEEQRNDLASDGPRTAYSAQMRTPDSVRDGLLKKILDHSFVEDLRNLGRNSRPLLASRAPPQGPYERKIDDMAERAECSTLCGTPYSPTCYPWDDHWDDHANAREGIQQQGNAAIMYGDMEGYDNYTSWIEARQRIKSARYRKKSRINPIDEPCWWSKSWSRTLYSEDAKMRCAGGLYTIYDDNGANKEAVEAIDWSPVG